MQDASALDPASVDIVFSAVESDAARELEPCYAATVPVLSTASAFRYEADVPIIIPGVNLAHATLIDEQRRRRGWKGFIIPIPNCTVTGLAITLKPLLDRFGVRQVLITLGAQGVVLCDEQGGCEHIPAFPVQAIDTTGAGDAFAAGVGIGLAQGYPLREAVRFACAAGALAATRAGAQAAMPSRAEVERLLSLDR